MIILFLNYSFVSLPFPLSLFSTSLPVVAPSKSMRPSPAAAVNCQKLLRMGRSSPHPHWSMLKAMVSRLDVYHYRVLVMVVSWLPSASSFSSTFSAPSSRCSLEAVTMHDASLLATVTMLWLDMVKLTSWRVEHVPCGEQPLTPPRLLPAPGSRYPALSFCDGDCFSSICQWVGAHNPLRIVLSVSRVNC